MNGTHFSKMVLENSRNLDSVPGCQYEPENLDESKVCFAKKSYVSNMHE